MGDLYRVQMPSISHTGPNNLSEIIGQITAFGMDKERPYRIDKAGATITEGSLFDIGGTLYQADYDTTISGTASDYVKLDPSTDGATAVASFVANLSGVTWSTGFKGYYDSSGNLYIFDEHKAFIAGVITELHTEDGISRARHGTKVYTASGTFVVPTGVTTLYISGCAAGGNGDSGNASGGGGEWALKKEFTVTPGDSLTVTIGAVGSNTSIGTLDLNHGGNASGVTPGTGGALSEGTGPGGDGSYKGNGNPGFQQGGAFWRDNTTDAYYSGGGGSYGPGASAGCAPGYGGGGSSLTTTTGGAGILIVEW